MIISFCETHKKIKKNMNINPTSYVPRDPIEAALIDAGNYHNQENWLIATRRRNWF